MNAFVRKFKDILDLIVFKHSIFALPFLFSSMAVGYKIARETGFADTPSLAKAIILGVIAAVSARNFAMAVNRLMDEDIDKDNPRCKNRPNISGRIGKKSVLAFIIANAFVFVCACYFINSLAFGLSFAVLFVLAIYSAFKRFSYLAHLVLGFCLGLAPIAASVIVLNSIHIYSVILCLGVMFWTAGFDLLYPREIWQKNHLFHLRAFSLFSCGVLAAFCVGKWAWHCGVCGHFCECWHFVCRA